MSALHNELVNLGHMLLEAETSIEQGDAAGALQTIRETFDRLETLSRKAPEQQAPEQEMSESAVPRNVIGGIARGILQDLDEEF